MAIRIRRTTKNIEKLIAKLEKLDKANVESGLFLEQGEHPEAEMTYVDLARMHEEGDGEFPPRSVRPMTLFSMSSTSFLNGVSKAVSNYLYRQSSIDFVLNEIAQDISDIAVSYFGKIDFINMPANETSYAREKGGNTPLVNEGYLRDAWSYRTSSSNVIINFN